MKYSIVLVHLGNTFHEYINTCISQIKSFNEETEIFIVTSKIHFNKFTDKVILISDNELPKTENHLNFIASNKLDTSFRSGFWKSALERFMYIEDVVKLYSLKNIFHFENDVLIYNSLLGINNECIKNNYDMVSTFDNDKRCIPGIVYFKDINVINLLNIFILKNSNINDMIILAKFAKDFPNLVFFFPVVPPNYKFPFLKRFKSCKIKKYNENFDKFKFVFDAAALGQYLGGIDPRNTINHVINPGFINESALYNVNDFIFYWELDEKNRKIPILFYNSARYKIFNLHIHCKLLSKFT